MTDRRARRRPLHELKRWVYRDGRPHRVAKLLNRYWARQYRVGGKLARTRDVELEVEGRSSGKPIRFPIVLADVDGDWFAVSMLGENANWVRNVRAAGGHASIRHGARREVRLTEVPVASRGPILKRYLEVAPGARPHMAVDRSAPIAAFESVARDHPVFLVEDVAPAPGDQAP